MLRMRKMLLVGMCFLSAAQLCGQAAKTPFDAFRDSVIDRQFAITTAFIVDEAGHVHDVWIARPSGYGMDEEAAKTVSAYVFKPATCHDRPVSTPLATEMNFQIF
ncbi:MAG TPA: energy transducer TonB [Acidobacteriaceae bacterium]|nr:energy transducer TonB [Acidobacteriaceae bacterium]